MRVPKDFEDLENVELGVEFKSADLGNLSASRKISDIPLSKELLLKEVMLIAWQKRERKDFSGAAKSYEVASKRFSNDPVFLNGYAQFLVTAEERAFRNPKKAIILAGEAVELTKGTVGRMLDTLAVAYYEDGQLKKAVAVIEKALPICHGIDDVKARAAKYRKELEER